jgi:16S rRNA (adenine1518-N6/adenine1519-N6)-dimethyltransferase
LGSIREQLASEGLAPSKARGQNFLRHPATATRLVEAIGIEPADAVVEIGPGLGQLTVALAAASRRLIALEVDRGLVELLANSTLPPNVEVRHQDVLTADLGGIARELGAPAAPVVLAGNLPYNISGRILGMLLSPRNPFRRFGLMLQYEVGERVLAAPDTPEYGTLSVWARLYTRAWRALELGPGEFVPRPKVRSSFLVFEPVDSGIPVDDVRALRRVVRAAFQHRRKTLRRVLRGLSPAADAALEAAEIDGQRRGETLSEAEFARLANALAAREPSG